MLDTEMVKLLGWVVWYDDGIFVAQTTFEEWCERPEEDRLLGKMLYFDNGRREIQQADQYYVAPHPSGFYTHGTCMDNKREETEKRYPGAVFKRGIWAPTEVWSSTTEHIWALRAWKDVRANLG